MEGDDSLSAIQTRTGVCHIQFRKRSDNVKMTFAGKTGINRLMDVPRMLHKIPERSSI